MRASLIWLLAGAASVGACVVGNIGGPAARAQDAPRPSVSAVSDETLKDVEVMRRVLVREGLGTRTGGNVVSADGRALDYYVTYVSGGFSASEAFVVPGQGATFVLRTSDSVAPANGADEAASADKPNAWDEEAAALDGKPVNGAPRRRVNRYDAAKVEALRTRVLDVLAKYGQKIRGLAPADRVTVVVVGGSGGGALFEPQVVASSDDGKLRSVLASGYGRAADGRTVLTIHVAVADCQAAGGGTMPADEFKRRAIVSAY